jgi:hypothetical protein
MDRRTFIAGAGTVLGGPLPAEAQQQARMDWRIGILSRYALDGPWSREVAQKSSRSPLSLKRCGGAID